MPAEIYEVAALAARFWFLLLMVIIVWRSYRWYARDRRVRKKRLDELPDAGYIGELVVMQSAGPLHEGDVLSVPFEGYLGNLRNNDVCLELESVAPRHLWFRYDREQGICLTALDGNEFFVDQLSSEEQPEGLYMVHGSWLRVGDALLRLRMFEGYEVKAPPQPAYARPGNPWDQEAPMGGYALQPEMPGMAAPDLFAPQAAPQPQEAEPAAADAVETYSPYGQRVRRQFTQARRSRRQDAAPQPAEPVSQEDNPYRSRRSIPGMTAEVAAHRFAPEEPEQTAPAAGEEAAPAAAASEPKQDTGAFSSMSVYAQLMARAYASAEEEQAPGQEEAPAAGTAVPSMADGGAAQADRPAAAVDQPFTDQPASAVNQPVATQPATAAARPEAAHTAAPAASVKPAPAAAARPEAAHTAAPAAKAKPVATAAIGVVPANTAKPAAAANHPAAARPTAAVRQPAAPSFAPARPAAEKPAPAAAKPASASPAAPKAAAQPRPSFAPQVPDRQEMVFEDPLPQEDSLHPIGQETFHPLMEEEGWDEWDEWEEPAPARSAVQPVKPEPRQEQPAAKPAQPEEDWPYLSRTDQWQAAALFADLLDEDGTDATTQPGSVYRSESVGSTTRRMLQRYFKGGGRR